MKVYVISRLVSYAISYSRIAYDTIMGLYENGIDVSHIGFSTHTPYFDKYTPFAIYPVSETGRGATQKRDLLLEEISNYKLEEPDVVFIIEDISCATIATRLRKIWPNTKIVMYTMFDGDHLTQTMLFNDRICTVQEGFKDINRIIVPTLFSYQVFSKFGIYPYITPLYFDERIFRPSKMIERPKTHTLLSIARNTSRKNLGNLLMAMSFNNDNNIILRLRTEVELHDHTSIDLGGLCINLRILDRVLFEQFNPSNANNDAELIYSYNDASVGVFPSMREGWCMPALEAMACGLPIIVTANTAMDSWVPRTMPRFTPSTSILSGGFTSIEQIVSPEEINRQINNSKELMKYSKEEIRHMVDYFTLSNYNSRILEHLSDLTK